MHRNRLLFLRLSSAMKNRLCLRSSVLTRTRSGMSLRDEMSMRDDEGVHARKLAAVKREGRRRLNGMTEKRGILEMSWQDKLDVRTKLDRILNSNDVETSVHLYKVIMGAPNPVPVHCVRTHHKEA